MTDSSPTGEVILFQTEDGQTKIEVRMVGETVWLSLNQMAELFQREGPNEVASNRKHTNASPTRTRKPDQGRKK